MQIRLKPISALKRRMTVGILADRIESEGQQALQQRPVRAKVDGFRRQRAT